MTTQPPASVTSGQPIGGVTGIVVAAEDNFGNLVTTYSGSVTVAVNSNLTGTGGTIPTARPWAAR